MPNMNKSQQGQSFIDMVLQQTGNFTDVIDASIDNNFSLSDNVPIGTEVNVKQAGRTMQNRPATAIVKKLPDFGMEQKGIGYMEIGKTFIVS